MIIIFDGLCNFCNAWVDFVLARDKKRLFQFAPSQSECGELLLRHRSLYTEEIKTIVLIDGDRVFTMSDAAIRVVGGLGAQWSIVYIFLLVPRPIRDACYATFAKRRYRWFGKRDVCRVPEARWEQRFLDRPRPRPGTLGD